jgi:hypothetical protein
MKTKTNTPSRLSDDELVAEVKRLAFCERGVTVDLITHLAELDKRRLYLAAGFSSLFTYCTEVLRLSEHAAFQRILAARKARRFPVILRMLADGSLNLTSVRLLAPHLTKDNYAELFAAASGKSKRELQKMLAWRYPQPDVASSIRKLPARRPSPEPPVTTDVPPAIALANAVAGREPTSAADEPRTSSLASSPSTTVTPPMPPSSRYRPVVTPSHRTDTRLPSPRAKLPARSYSSLRTFCATRFRAAIPPQSSTAR